jgi:hypothetical protein
MNRINWAVLSFTNSCIQQDIKFRKKVQRLKVPIIMPLKEYLILWGPSISTFLKFGLMTQLRIQLSILHCYPPDQIT